MNISTVKTVAPMSKRAIVAIGAAPPSPSPRLRGEGALPQEHARGEASHLARPLPPVLTDGRVRATSPRAPGEVKGRAASAEINSALYRLMTWMSPAYPVGAFSYSGGIEWAVEAGDINNADSLRGWLETMIRHGSLFCDAVIFTHAHRAVLRGDDQTIAEIAELAVALIGCKERFLETTAQGQAFMQITRSAWPSPALDRLVAAWDGPLAYPVVVAAACAGHGIEVAPALHALLHGMASNLISAGMRLIPLGQTDGQRVLAALETSITQTAERALATGMDDIATATVRADIASMRHETQYTRLFRS
jgi:urease accessory protein